MSHYATPFIVINLGCEMIYVIEQRLIAQNISADKSERVLLDITTVLLHPKLLEELFLPQPVAAHSVVKQLLRDISATSIMKLDDYSMDKLWDLITMIHKWQLFIATNQNIFDITRRHIKSIAKLMPQYYPRSIFDGALSQFEKLTQKINNEDYKCLYNTTRKWFSEYHTKVSVLIRLGIQKKDGTFNSPAAINQNIINNLGENIYKYDTKKDISVSYMDSKEINCILSTFEINSKKDVIELQLPISFGDQASDKKTIKFQNLNFEAISTKMRFNAPNDFSFTQNIPKTPQEDLLEMLTLTTPEDS